MGTTLAYTRTLDGRTRERGKARKGILDDIEKRLSV